MPETGKSPRLRVLFMGTPELALPGLQACHEAHHVVAVATQPDRRAGRGRKVLASPVKRWALQHDVPVLQPKTLRDPSVAPALAEHEPDVIVVIAYGLILPAQVLQLPRLGCVNVHASLLPRHRGASPIQAAILAGDAVTGVSTMLMDEGLDTGPVLRRREVEITDDDTAGSLGERLGAVGAELLRETLPALAAGSLRPQPQEESEATTTRLLRKSDGSIDWAHGAAQIDRHVRAMQPWPVAWTEHEGERLRVWAVAPGPPSDATPGVVVSVAPLLVACGEGESVQVRELQRAGGRRLPAPELLRGYELHAGAELGSPDPAA